MRGRNPSCTAWRMIENDPAITACEAITAAAVASAIIGYNPHSGTAR